MEVLGACIVLEMEYGEEVHMTRRRNEAEAEAKRAVESKREKDGNHPDLTLPLTLNIVQKTRRSKPRLKPMMYSYEHEHESRPVE